MDISLTAYENAKNTGFTANPYLFSSANWILHELGIYFYNSGKTEPKGAKMSRGYSVKVSDMAFKAIFDKQTIKFERMK